MQACADLLLLSTHLSVGAVFHHCYNDVLSSHEWQLLTHVFLYHLTIQTHAHMQKVYSRHVAWGNSPPGSSKFPPEICRGEFSKLD